MVCSQDVTNSPKLITSEQLTWWMAPDIRLRPRTLVGTPPQESSALDSLTISENFEQDSGPVAYRETETSTVIVPRHLEAAVRHWEWETDMGKMKPHLIYKNIYIYI